MGSSSQERAMKECKEASCLADLGRKVNADYVAQGRVGRFDGNLTIKTELYNSKSGVMVGSFTGTSKNISGLLALIDEKASILFKKLPGASDEPTTIPPSVAKSIDVLGAALIYVGYGKDRDMVASLDKYRAGGQSEGYYNNAWKDAEDSRSSGNTFYVIGGMVLASGIGVHIWF